MQLDNLYPTAATTYGIEMTAPFMSIPTLINDMGDQYLMGYVPSDGMGVDAVDITNTGDIITMTRKPGNFGWGYCHWGYNYGAGPGTIYYNNGGTLERSWGIDYDCAFINAAEMCRLNTRPGMSIYLSVASVHNNLIDGNKMTQFANYLPQQVGAVFDHWLDFTIDQYHDIIKNDTPLFERDVRVSNENGVTVHLTIRPSDFDNDDGMKFVLMPTEYDFVLHCRIMGFRMNESKYYYDSANIPTFNIMPFFQIPHNDGKMILMPGSLDLAQINITYSNGGITAGRGNIGGYYNNKYIQNGDNAIIFGGFDLGDLSVNDIDFTRVFSSSLGWWAFVGNYVLLSTSVGSGMANFRVNEMYTPRDVYNYVRFFHKRTDTPSDSYSTADTVTVFETSEMPTFDTVSGTLSEIAARLRPWQIPGVDITSNTFSPEDIPEPIPPEPGDDDDTGDSITRPSAISVGGTNGFVTQYVLTAAQIAALGRGLWAGVADRAFWDNWLWTALLEAGTFNVSDILQFFISLRVYPFSLINVSSYQGTGSAALWLGRGTKAIDLGTQDKLGTISQYADILDAGSLTVPAYYGDFRDYDHVSITLHAPYIGTISLAAGDVVGAALHLFYAIDFASGSCTAYLDISRGGIQYPICIGSGVIGADVPLSADSAARRVAAAIDLGFDTVAGISAVFSGDPLSAAGAAANMAKQQPTIPTLSATGKGFDSFAGAQTAYIQIRRGKYAEGKTPGAAFKSTYGEQLDQPAAIGSFTGFTKFVNVDTAGLQCDAAERSAILTQLQSGVYI